MKAVFFDYNINFGGAPRGSVSLCSLLQSSGEEVIIYDVYGKNNNYVNFISEKKVPMRVILPESKKLFIGGTGKFKRLLNMMLWLPDFIRIVLRTRALLKTDNVDLVWVNNNKSLVTISFAAFGLRAKKILYHRGWATEQSIGIWFRFFILCQCDALIGHSKATVKNLSNLFPFKKVFYVPNSVSIKSKASLPLTVNSAKNDFVVLLPAARPVREKGHHTAVMALAKLVEKGFHNVSLYFPGEVAVGVSDKYFADLKALIKSLGLSDRVKFIGWLDSLDEVIKESSVVILPSHTEGFPRVIIESMLLGTPVVATPVGGIPEAIVHNETGLIVNVEDVDMLANAISFLILNPEHSCRMASNAYNFAMSNFSQEKQLLGIKQIFSEVLANAR